MTTTEVAADTSSAAATPSPTAPESSTGATPRRSVSPTTVLLVSSLGVFMAFIDATIVNVAFPDIRKSFDNASLGSLTWILNSYNVVFAAFLVPAGRISDLLGRRRVFTFGVAIFTLSSAASAIAPSLGFLIGARVVQAIGAAAMVPASLALVLHAYGPARRAHAVAVWGALAAVAAGLGPAAGGVLVQIDSWRLTFLVNVPLGLLGLALTGRMLIESRAPGRRRMPDIRGAGIFALTIALFTFGIVEGPTKGWESAIVLGPIAAAITSGWIFARRNRSHSSPVFDPDLFRVRTFVSSNALSLLVGAGYFAYLLCNVLFLTTVWGYSELDAGLALTPAPFVAAAVARPLGKLIDRLGYAGVAAFGAAVWTTGVVLLITVVGAEPDFVGHWLPIMVVLGIGAGATLPTLGAAAVAAAPGERFATATAINSVARQLGAVLGVALLVAVIGTPDPRDPQAVLDAFDRGWAFAGGCLLAALLLVATMRGIIRPAEASAAEAEAEAERIAALPTYPDLPVLGRMTPPERPPVPARSTAAEVLAEVSIFSELSQELREEVAERAEIVHVPGGAHLFRAGDPADALYVLLAGRCEIVGADDEHLMTVGRGAVLGELGLITESPRSASVHARRDTEMLKLTHGEFERLLAEEPTFAVGLTRELGRQLQASRPRVTPPRSGDTIIALVPIGDVRIERFAHELVAAMCELAETTRVDRPEAGRDPAETLVRLEHLERHNDRIVFVSTPLKAKTPDAWAEFCLRQADRVVAVVDEGTPPEWVRYHPGLLECDLVITGDGSHSHQWVDEVRPAATHRVRPTHEERDVRRMARRLTGCAVGLVLSGGGARAFAHLGVLEELAGAGVEIDRIAGVSMGAFIGALYAQELSVEEVDARIYEEFIRRRPLGDYNVPRVSLSRGERAKRMLLRNLPGQIEQLPREFFCLSADLISGEPVRHRTGRLAYAVSASMCLPVMVPPVADGGRYLVDGGALNNLPVEDMARDSEGPIIAVDVTARSEHLAGSTMHDRVHAQWPWDDEAPLPTIGETITRLVLMGSVDTAAAARRHADLLIQPEDDGVGLFEFHMIDAMRESGRRAARRALVNAPPSLFTR